MSEYGFTPEVVEILNSQLSQNMLKAYDEGRSHGIDIGVSTERERIIKLLEDFSNAKLPFFKSAFRKAFINVVLRVIKGEI